MLNSKRLIYIVMFVALTGGILGLYLISMEDIPVESIGTSKNLKEAYDLFWTTGVIQGGNVISHNSTTGDINISGGYAVLRTSASHNATLKVVKFEGKNFTMAVNEDSYIGLNYSSGNPVLIKTTNFEDITGMDSVTLFQVHREDTDFQHISAEAQNVDMGLKLRRMLYSLHRYDHASGSMVGNPSDLFLSVTSGLFYYGVNPINSNAHDSSTGETFEYYWKNGSYWNETHATRFNNTQWNNNDTLTDLTGNRYKVDWIYLELSDNISECHPAVVYSQAEYNTLAASQASTAPSSIPPSLQQVGVLIGRAIIQKNAVNVTEIDSAFSSVFLPTLATNHNSLSGLQGGTVNEYYHLTSAEYSTVSNGDNTKVNKTGGDTMNGSYIINGSLNIIDGIVGSSGSIVNFSDSNNIARSWITPQGIQNWRFNTGTEIGYIAYATPGNNPNICFFDSAYNATNRTCFGVRRTSDGAFRISMGNATIAERNNIIIYMNGTIQLPQSSGTIIMKSQEGVGNRYKCVDANGVEFVGSPGC